MRCCDVDDIDIRVGDEFCVGTVGFGGAGGFNVFQEVCSARG
jgi:hypothetical protein